MVLLLEGKQGLNDTYLAVATNVWCVGGEVRRGEWKRSEVETGF